MKKAKAKTGDDALAKVYRATYRHSREGAEARGKAQEARLLECIRALTNALGWPR